MEDSNNNSGGKSRNLTYILIFVLFLIVIALLGGGLYIGHSRINQLTRQLNQTQKQVQNVQQEANKTKEDTTQAAMNGIKDTAGAIKDVENPVIRLALAQAYAQNLKQYLTKSSQTDLDTILLYVNDNPKVLVTKNPTLPKEVALAVSNLKTAVRNLKIAGVATMQKIDKELYTQGEVVTLTGTINYVEDDTDLSGSIFTLTDSKTGYVYYFEFNEANSKIIEETMDGKEVTVTVKVTSKANEPLTFQVIKGPTLVTTSPAPSITNTPTSTVNPTP